MNKYKSKIQITVNINMQSIELQSIELQMIILLNDVTNAIISNVIWRILDFVSIKSNVFRPLFSHVIQICVNQHFK